MRWSVKLHVMLKRDVADVQGNAIAQSLARHGDPVSDVKVGKYFEFAVDADDETTAREVVDRLAHGTFGNPVIEHYWYELSGAEE